MHHREEHKQVSTTVLDYTTGAVKEVLEYLKQALEASKFLHQLPHFQRTTELEDFYIPLRVSKRRIHTIGTKINEVSHLADQHQDKSRKAYQHRTEAAFIQLASPEEEIVVLWESARSDLRKVVILGDPGQGKTTLLLWELRMTATESITGLTEQIVGLSGVQIPLYVRLAEVAESGKDIFSYALNELQARGYPPSFLRWLTEASERGQLTFLLDGLDEVYKEKQKRRLDKKLDILVNLYPNCRFVITSRILGYASCSVEKTGTALELVLLEPPEIDKFVRSWFGEDASAHGNFLRSVRRTPQLINLARNPLLLSLLCMLYVPNVSLPDRATELYRRCLERFLRDWRAITTDETRFVDKLELLEDAAFDLWLKGSEFFSARDLKLAFEKHPRYKLLVRTAPQRSLIREFTHEDGILVKAGSDTADVPYMFLHLTFQQFLTASAIARRINNRGWDECELTVAGTKIRAKDFIATKSWDPEWQEVIALIAGQLTNSVPLLRLLNNQSLDDCMRHRLFLAGLCLPEIDRRQCVDLTRQIARDIINLCWSVDTMRDLSPYLRAAAGAPDVIDDALNEVNKLMKNDDTASVALRIETLGHIGQGAKDISCLSRALVAFAMHPHDNVRSSAAIAMGNLTYDVQRTSKFISTLIKLLKDNDMFVKKSSAESLAKITAHFSIDDSDLVSALCHALEDNYFHVRAYAATALGNNAPFTYSNKNIVHALVRLLDDPDRLVRKSAAEALAKLCKITDQSSVVTLLRRCLENGSASKRIAAAEALANMSRVIINDSQIIETLLHGLEREREENEDPLKHNELRLRAMTALANIPMAFACNERVIAALRRQLDDSDSYVILRASETLGNFGEVAASDPETIPALLRRLETTEVTAAGGMFLLQSLHMSGLLNALGNMGSPAAAPDSRVLPTLLKIVDHPDRKIRSSVAEALGNLGQCVPNNLELINAMFRLVDDPDWDVCASAVDGIAKIGNGSRFKADIVAKLLPQLKHDNRNLRASVVDALETLHIRVFEEESGELNAVLLDELI